jgi:hypothetical protein
MADSTRWLGVIHTWLHSRRKSSAGQGWNDLKIVDFDFDDVASNAELQPLSAEGEASARDLLFDLLSQALTIFRNCIRTGAHDRLFADESPGIVYLTQGVHRLPALMKAASVSGSSYQTIAEEMFGDSQERPSSVAGEETARDYLFDRMYEWLLVLRLVTADRALWTLANAMHNQPGLMKKAARSDGDYRGVILEFFRWVPADYRVWAIQTLRRQPRPDPVLVDRLTTFAGGEDSWRRQTITIHHPDGRREQRKWVSDPTIQWLCDHYEADNTT